MNLDDKVAYNNYGTFSLEKYVKHYGSDYHYDD